MKLLVTDDLINTDTLASFLSQNTAASPLLACPKANNPAPQLVFMNLLLVSTLNTRCENLLTASGFQSRTHHSANHVNTSDLRE